MAVKFDHQFNASAEQLWAIVGTPDRVDWVPGAESCAFDGEVRSLHLPGAGDIKERILAHDPDTKTMAYSCFETPAPLQSHHAKMAVVANDQGCRLIWETAVTPVEFETFIRTSMEGCLEQLAELLDEH
jgi:hypothetical protein